jgi:hypothetical protein
MFKLKSAQAVELLTFIVQAPQFAHFGAQISGKFKIMLR